MKICILPNLKKSGAEELTLKLAGWLEENAVDFVLPEEDAARTGLSNGRDKFELFKDVDCVLVLGGDGAFLRAVSLMERQQLPILGVNMGQLGFLAEITASQLSETLPKIIAAQYTIDKRALLDISMSKDGIEFSRLTALNEVVIAKHEPATLVQLGLYINNELFHIYKCDALIISSPTGSTAYSLSAGGPIVSPKCRVMIVTPVCPHDFFNRSLVVSESDVLEVRPVAADDQYCIDVDGRRRNCQLFDSINISISDVWAQLINIRENLFFDSIKSKLIK